MMWTKRFVRLVTLYAITSTILYSCALLWFLQEATFESTWKLYIGNALFAIGIILFILSYDPPEEGRKKVGGKLMGGHITIITGIILSVLVALLLLTIFVPNVFHQSSFTDKPAQMEDNIQGILFVIIINATIGNVCAGSFASLLFTFVIDYKKRKQQITG